MEARLMCFALRAAQVTCCCRFLPPFKPISGLAELGIFSMRDFHSFLLRRPGNEETLVALTLSLDKLNSHRNGSQGCQNTSYNMALCCCIYNISLLNGQLKIARGADANLLFFIYESNTLVFILLLF